MRKKGHGYAFPDTPMMAFHRGDLARLKDFLGRDPGLIERRFGCLEIYPPESGCAKAGRSGMHWTPIDGTTLLHLAIDFDEDETFELLLEHGADVNARANVDAQGFGGQRRSNFVALEPLPRKQEGCCRRGFHQQRLRHFEGVSEIP